MDTHRVVCEAHRTAPQREISRRYRRQELHLPDLKVTETSHRPPYRVRSVGRRIRGCMLHCCVGNAASRDRAAAAGMMLGGVATLTAFQNRDLWVTTLSFLILCRILFPFNS